MPGPSNCRSIPTVDGADVDSSSLASASCARASSSAASIPFHSLPQGPAWPLAIQLHLLEYWGQLLP
eukprot:4403025-Pyramimonas_sp.AAC.1